MGGAMAAGLTALMILLFLGNWRLTLIILASIPLSIVTAVLVMYCMRPDAQHHDLGGFALAVGILVDNSTVVIENVERHLELRKDLLSNRPSSTGPRKIGVPTLLSTLAICIVFVPIFLLQGTAKYLFSPLALSVCISLLASLVLSFTLVPVLFKYLMRSHARTRITIRRIRIADSQSVHPRSTEASTPGSAVSAMRITRRWLSWCVSRPLPTVDVLSSPHGRFLPSLPLLGEDFFPQVDAGQMRLHVRCPAGTRIETTRPISPASKAPSAKSSATARLT
jgi:multidrug efflux pump subunit AcrB